MTDLKMIWIAQFKDGRSVSQITPENQEVSFRTILDQVSDLSSFQLSHREKSLRILIDLTQGRLYVNNIQAPMGDSKLKKNIRLIYFRRHQVDMNISGDVKSRRMSYFIGFQYLDEQDENQKVLLQLDQDGNILIE